MRMVTVRRRGILGLLTGLAVTGWCLAACSGSGGAGGVWDVPEVDRQIILQWLLCTDCIEGELDAVVHTGDRLVPYLSAALLDGPTRADVAADSTRAIAAVASMARYRDRRAGVLSPLTTAESAAAVQSQRDAFLLKYRLRAAQALQRIDAARASTDVERWCDGNPPELLRNPQYRASFKVIGGCVP